MFGLFSSLYNLLLLGILISILAVTCLNYEVTLRNHDNTSNTLLKIQQTHEDMVNEITKTVSKAVNDKLASSALITKADFEFTLKDLFSHSDDS